jgi:hypothetical protein
MYFPLPARQPRQIYLGLKPRAEVLFPKSYLISGMAHRMLVIEPLRTFRLDRTREHRERLQVSADLKSHHTVKEAARATSDHALGEAFCNSNSTLMAKLRPNAAKDGSPLISG